LTIVSDEEKVSSYPIKKKIWGAAYIKAKERVGYKRNICHFLTELQHIRLACNKKNKSSLLKYELESIPPDLKEIAKFLHITNQSI